MKEPSTSRKRAAAMERRSERSIPLDKRPISLRERALLVLGGLGVGVSAYLVWVHYSGSLALCTGAGGCEQVQASRYSAVAGVPVALLGLSVYLLVLALTVWRAGAAGSAATLISLNRFALALAGALYSAYLTYVEIFEIGAICPWCVSSAVLITAIGVLAAQDVSSGAF